MSVKKFKVGDKVRVIGGVINFYRAERRGDLRKYLFPPFRYEDDLVQRLTKKYPDIATVTHVFDDNRYWLNDEEVYIEARCLTLAEKSLENLEKGDLVDCGYGGSKKVLAAMDGVYLLSKSYDHEAIDGWYTIREIKKKGWEPVQPEESATETIEVGGKKYNKQEFEEAVKDLEPID